MVTLAIVASVFFVRQNALKRTLAEEEPKYSVRIYITRGGEYRQTEPFKPEITILNTLLTSKYLANCYVQESFRKGYFDLSDQKRYVPINEAIDVWLVKTTKMKINDIPC